MNKCLHCWEDGPKQYVYDADGVPIDWVGSTCMLEKDHDGPHEWTPDNEIGVSFLPVAQ